MGATFLTYYTDFNPILAIKAFGDIGLEVLFVVIMVKVLSLLKKLRCDIA